MTTHDYSTEWYSTFLDPISPAQTDAEVAFISRHLPLESHGAILDLCCGPGRHALPLARRGYRVTGLDINPAQIARAAADAPPGSTFEVHDIRKLASRPGEFDGVLNLWASFGFFDDATNAEILRQIQAHLRPGGRAILDVYNRDCMTKAPTLEETDRGGMAVKTRRSWKGTRLRVELKYGSGGGDEFEWHVYTPPEFEAACASAGLETVRSCSRFDESRPPSAQEARMQYVLERR